MNISQVNLMENIKASTSRDFRINVQIVQESLQVSSGEDDEEEENDDEEQNDAAEASPEDEQVS